MDYVKSRLEGINVKRLKSLSCLDFNSRLSVSTGDVDDSILVAKYHFCEIKLIETQKGTLVYFVGSIHKMWNSLNNTLAPNYSSKKKYKGYNGNLFTINDFIKIKRHLEELFDCKPHQMFFENIELGVNTEISFCPKLFLAFILFYKDKAPEFRYGKNYVQFELDEFFIKIYNKSGQYGISNHVLRFEIKVRKMRAIKGLAIKTFADITHDKQKVILKFLLEKFDEVMYYDFTIRKHELSKPNLKKVNEYSDSNKWVEFYNTKKKYRELKRAN